MPGVGMSLASRCDPWTLGGSRRRHSVPEMPLRGTLRHANSFASYHIHVTPAVSCNYALFRATARRYPSYSQQLPHSFYRHGGWYPLGSLCSHLCAFCVAPFPILVCLCPSLART